MPMAALAAATLVIAVATSPMTGPTATPPMSLQEKRAVVRPLVHFATECIARSVTGDPAFGKRDLGDLIVDLMPRCLPQVRAMIDAYDRCYGAGSGEAFFIGPYLDLLPTAVDRWSKEHR